MPQAPFALLRGGTGAGHSQAALRVLMGIAACDRPAMQLDARLSLDELQDLTLLSRSMVLHGIRLAEASAFIAYSPGKPRTKSHFTLLQGDTPGAGGWAMLPNEQVRTRIPRIPHRGDVALAALKIYLTLVAARPNKNLVVRLRHDTLRDKTGCQARHVRSAISLLANEGLIHVLADDEDGGQARPVQQYQICGKLDAPKRWNGDL